MTPDLLAIKMKPNAAKNRKTTQVHGRGTKSSTRRGKDEDRNERTTIGRLRDQTEEVVSRQKENFLDEPPHPKWSPEDEQQ